MVYIQFPAATAAQLGRPHVDWEDSGSYYDTRDFKLYAAHIGEIIDDAGREGITIRGIHGALGHLARREWTMDAIDSLKNIENLGVLCARYRRI